jgi:hypothetical protein
VAKAAAAWKNSVDIQKYREKIGGQTVTVTVVGGGQVA